MKRKHLSGRIKQNSKRHFFFSFAFLVFTINADQLLAAEISPEERIAFLGDSLSTGAVAHPDLSFSKPALWDIFRGRKQLSLDPAYFAQHSGMTVEGPLAAPQRLWPTLREFLSPAEWFGLNLINAVSMVYLDTEQYSWAYQFARKMGYAPNQMLFAAQDGSRMQNARRQLDRVLAMNNGQLPRRTFVFFSGNDLCGPTMDYVTEPDEYAAHLKEFVEYLLAKSTQPEGGSDVYFLGFLGVMQLTLSPEILAKNVPAHGQVRTCKELGSGTLKEDGKDVEKFLNDNPEAMAFFSFFPEGPYAICPTVFGHNIDKTDDQRSLLANRIRAFRKLSAETLQELSVRISKSPDRGRLRFHFVNDTNDIVFRGEDIANDCFHLSIDGHRRISDAVSSWFARN